MSKNTLPAVILTADETQSAAKARVQGRVAPMHGRAADFITQLFVQTDAQLRRTIGCQYVIEQRAQAYGAALANRPSVRQGADQSTKVNACS